MNNDIEVNPDGTADCDFCKKSKPAAGFTIELLYWGDYYQPPEYGQMCQDCRDKTLRQEAEMENYYSNLQTKYEMGEL